MKNIIENEVIKIELRRVEYKGRSWIMTGSTALKVDKCTDEYNKLAQQALLEAFEICDKSEKDISPEIRREYRLLVHGRSMVEKISKQLDAPYAEWLRFSAYYTEGNTLDELLVGMINFLIKHHGDYNKRKGNPESWCTVGHILDDVTQCLRFAAGDAAKAVKFSKERRAAEKRGLVCCTRCGGRGYFPTRQHGACFDCGGARFVQGDE